MFKTYHCLQYLILINMVFISGNAQMNCCSSITISVDSPDAFSLAGFSIKLDGKAIGVTNSYGYLQIRPEGISKGNHKLIAAKKEDDATYYGEGKMEIYCINTSNGKDCTFLINANKLQNRDRYNY